jgi:hypothetical protein
MYPQDNVVCHHTPARDSFPACRCYVYDHATLRPQVIQRVGEEALEAVRKLVFSRGWLGLSAANPQKTTIWGLTSFDPSNPT